MEEIEERVSRLKEPIGQKYHIGELVKIKIELPKSKFHFPSGKLGVVRYTYAHAYGGENVKSYCLNVLGIGEVSWYDEEDIFKFKEV